jgi:hypothetical protein
MRPPVHGFSGPCAHLHGVGLARARLAVAEQADCVATKRGQAGAGVQVPQSMQQVASFPTPSEARLQRSNRPRSAPATEARECSSHDPVTSKHHSLVPAPPPGRARRRTVIAVERALHQLRHLAEYLGAGWALVHRAPGMGCCGRERRGRAAQPSCPPRAQHAGPPRATAGASTHLGLADLGAEHLVKAEAVLLAVDIERERAAAVEAAHRAVGVRPHTAEHADLRRVGG